ncbi:hypothetical protein HPB47_015555 [Ixodes persulcatus]|uniref:Uncharacterized protein n=1 Tax=Ixodes persulcatus TaxID=34615 RepID=A0AC60QV52_IXOPE|nr:hypothetical protein HPB47_015555 [Ixodes persulcatus]
MKYVAQVYNSCIDRTGENQSETLAEFASFLNKRVLRRPEDLNEVSPLDVALDLSIRWQMPFWFDVQLLGESSSKRRRIYFSPSRRPTFWKSAYNEFTDERTFRKFSEDFRRIFLYHNVANANYSEADFRVAADIMGSIYKASFRKQKRPAILSFHDLEGFLPAGKSNNWTGLLNKNFGPTPPFSDRDIILVSDIEILEVLKRLLRTHGWTHILNQLAWWFVQAYAVVASDDAFVIKYGGKESASAMKPIFCEIQVEEAYTLPLLVDHVSLNYNSSDRTAIDVLLESVIMAAIAKIGECDWMDNRSREAAVDKLREIFVNLWPREDIYAEFFPPERQKQKSYVKYWIRDHELSASQIGTAVYYEKNRMAHNLRDETFEYDYLLNNVSLPMLALENPFYDRRGSVSFNYGALGSIFARKVVMSFDPQGINHLPNGTLHSWLSEDSKATFMQKVTCGVEDFQPNIFPEIPGLEHASRSWADGLGQGPSEHRCAECLLGLSDELARSGLGGQFRR